MLGGLLILLAAQAHADISRTPACAVAKSDYIANSQLSFDDFDQKGVLPSTSRKLGERGCWKQAAEATADYLMRGPVASPGEQRILLFHLGQALALSGEERRAADFVAATRRPEDPAGQKSNALRWNDYVIGIWAFLTKDRAMLIKSRDAVLAGSNDDDRLNGNLLAAIERCFDKPYIVAFDKHCGR